MRASRLPSSSLAALARRRRVSFVGTLAIVAGAAACGANSGQKPVGISDRVPGGGTPREAKDGGLRDGAAALPTDYRASFTKVNKARFLSHGHASGRWQVDVFANELGASALAARAKEAPVGAVLVAEHYESDGRAGPVMVMEKKAKGFSAEHGDWRWVVVGSKGQLVEDGVVETCTGCHDDAPMDGLFPVVE